MSGALSLWLLSLSREQRESDSAGRPKPEASAHSVIDFYNRWSTPTNQQHLNKNAHICDTGIFHNHYNLRSNQLNAANTLAVISSTEPTPSIRLYFGVPSAAARFW